MNSRFALAISCLIGLALSGQVQAGSWGENWGTMVWGSVAVTAPAAPAITGTEAGFNAITVSFLAGGDGGSPISEYTVTCGSQSATGPSSPITVTGLDGTTQYSCTVVATNAVGSSVPSPAVDNTTLTLRRLNIPIIKAAVDAQSSPD